MSVLLGTREKPGHVTIKGRGEKTLGRRGKGGTLASRLHWVVGWAAQSGRRARHGSERRGQVPWTWTSSERPIDSAAGGPEAGPVHRSNGFGPSRERNFKHGPQRRSHTEKQRGTAHFANSSAPPAEPKTYFQSPNRGCIQYLAIRAKQTFFKLDQPKRA